MSELYTSEPPTSGKVIVETNYGNIDIELFTLEAPKSCRNFIQHCLNKYYNGCIFFKIFKNFMIQTGDPTNTGNGGESIYHEDFRDELHSRLKFSHRGIVAMANKNKPNSNGSQFFITLDKCSEMDKKYTIFGKVTGPTFFNAVTISNLSANEDGVPLMKDEEKPRITNTQVVINPFKDLKPTVVIKDDDNSGKSKKKKKPKKLKIKYSTDKMFFQDSEDESENNDNKEIKNKDDNNEYEDKKGDKNELKEEKDNKEIKQNENNEIKEQLENQNNENIEKDNKEDNDEGKEIIEEKNKEENKNDPKIHKGTENKDNDDDEDEENENSEESESKSLSSDDHEVKNAKELLVDDEENIRKNKRKNIEDYKREINLLRKKVKREKEEVYNEEQIKKKVEEEKLTKMDILQKYNHNYVKTNQANKLSNDERANKLKNFKSLIGGGDSERWYKTKLKFQTDSQKAFALDMINKELEKNGNGNMDDNI